jgi:hypothetical protein
VAEDFLRNLTDAVKDKIGDAGRAVGEALEGVKRRIVGKEVTVYPTYAYRDRADPQTWVIPVRVWVHDDRDTPFVEEFIRNRAARHFEQDLGRPLEAEERARLAACLENFIADNKSDEEIEFTLAGEVFRPAHRTSPNGVLEDTLRISDAKVRPLLAGRPAGDTRLPLSATAGGGHGAGEGRVVFLEPEGLSVVSDIDDTIKVTHIPAGKKTVLRNTFLKEFKAAAGMRDMYAAFSAEQFGARGDVSFHYISGSPWQLYRLVSRFLIDEEKFPAGTFHMKNLRLNPFESGALDTVKSFALGGDLATLDQKVRQITSLMINLPRRRFVLVGDSGERDPEVYRAIRELFPAQVARIYIRDVLAERLTGMERITGADVHVSLDTSEIVSEMRELIAQAAGDTRREPTL